MNPNLGVTDDASSHASRGVVPFDLSGPIPSGTAVLEASAGTGKTFAIAHLALRLVAEEGLGLERILVVTFTNAAAAELRERIRARLVAGVDALRAVRVVRDEALESPLVGFDPPLADFARTSLRRGRVDEAEWRIERALAAFDQHRIGTIHGFCQRLLARHAFECGIDFDFELAEDLEAMLRQAAYDFTARAVADEEPAFVARTSGALSLASLVKLAACAVAEPRAEVLPARPADRAPVGQERVRQAWQAMQDAWRGHRRDLRAAIAEAVGAGAIRGQYKLGKAAEWESAFAALDDEIAAMPVAFDGSASKTFLALRDVQTSNLVNTKFRERFVPRLQSPFFDAFARFESVAGEFASYLEAQELARLHDFVAFARAHVEAQKRAQRVRSFDDLLRSVDDALAGPSGETLAARIREEITVALIDEFQDTDPVQWSIFERAFHGSGSRLLLIGDPKQAIYAFRGADLATYLRARRAADGQHALATNHRSDGALLAALEALYVSAREPFGPADARLGEPVEFVPVSAAHSGTRASVGGVSMPPIRLYGLGSGDALDGDEDTQAGEADAALADLGRLGSNAKSDEATEPARHPTAVEVARTLRSGVMLVGADGAPRALRASDCAVLVRGKAAIPAIERDLRALGVPCVVRTEQSVYDSDEARELSLVLAAALAPTDRRCLASALATDLVGATLSDIAALETDEAALDHHYEQMRRLGDALRMGGFAAFFRRLLDDLDVVGRLLGAAGGERRVTNLAQLGELLNTEAEREHLGPEALLARLQRLRSEGDAASEERRVRLESDADAVEIATIHVAKGLEWGFVFCDSLGRASSVRDEAAVILRDEHGRASLHLGPKSRLGSTEGVVERLLALGQGEERRLAYVALTRARHAVHVRVPAKPAGTPFEQLFFRGVQRGVWVRTSKSAKAPLDCVEFTDRASACEHVARALAPHVALATRADLPSAPRPWEGRTPPVLAVRVYDRVRALDADWRITSYTGLSSGRPTAVEHERVGSEDEASPERGGDPAAPAVDRAAEQAVRVVPSPGVRNDEGPLAVFQELRGGRELGIDVHAVLEQAETFDVERLERLLLARAVRRGGDLEPPEGASPSGAAVPRRLAEALVHALRTPLFVGSPFNLAEASPRSMLREAEFVLPVGGGTGARDAARGLSAQALAEVFARHGRPTMPAEYASRAASLALSPALRGFLVGSIDLVFEHEGRIYVADYKTTRLGDGLDAYAREVLPDAMVAHDYTLQALIYALAVHRHLRLRERDYDYEARFGGVLHLFLRAMDPSRGPTHGVFFDRPPRAQIEAFERALGLLAEVP